MAPINPLYTPALMEHSSEPDYKYEMECATCTHEGVNPSCGDDLTLSLRINDKGVIEEAAWQGIGCAVSQASADMMADLVTGETVEEACMVHGIDVDKLLALVNEEANKPIAE